MTDEVTGPEPIDGDVYLLAPHPGDLPIGGGEQAGRYRLLIQLENERYGVNIKLPGVATADPHTGQLTATFTENPQLPAGHITVTLKGGPWASLATPVTCGSFTTTSDLVPWSTPGTPDAHPTASFTVGSGPGGSGCPSSAATRPFSPAMSAGTESSQAGASSPFVLRLTRADGEQELSSLEALLPKGLAARFAGSALLLRCGTGRRSYPLRSAKSRPTRPAPPRGSARSPSAPARAAIPSTPTAVHTSPALIRAPR